jgi:hypothetical protein
MILAEPRSPAGRGASARRAQTVAGLGIRPPIRRRDPLALRRGGPEASEPPRQLLEALTEAWSPASGPRGCERNGHTGSRAQRVCASDVQLADPPRLEPLRQRLPCRALARAMWKEESVPSRSACCWSIPQPSSPPAGPSSLSGILSPGPTGHPVRAFSSKERLTLSAGVRLARAITSRSNCSCRFSRPTPKRVKDLMTGHKNRSTNTQRGARSAIVTGLQRLDMSDGLRRPRSEAGISERHLCMH